MEINHIAININGVRKWAEINNDVQKSYQQSFIRIKEIIKAQISHSIPYLTFLLVKEEHLESDKFPTYASEANFFFESLLKTNFCEENQIKVSVLGKWYDLSHEFVDKTRELLNATKNNSKFHLTFCINYNAQDEIADSLRVIAKKITLEKLEPEKITKELIKHDLSSSSLPPPDAIIITGGETTHKGTLLWDSINSKYIFSDKLWPDYDTEEFNKEIEKLK